MKTARGLAWMFIFDVATNGVKSPGERFFLVLDKGPFEVREGLEEGQTTEANGFEGEVFDKARAGFAKWLGDGFDKRESEASPRLGCWSFSGFDGPSGSENVEVIGGSVAFGGHAILPWYNDGSGTREDFALTALGVLEGVLDGMGMRSERLGSELHDSGLGHDLRSELVSYGQRAQAAREAMLMEESVDGPSGTRTPRAGGL